MPDLSLRSLTPDEIRQLREYEEKMADWLARRYGVPREQSLIGLRYPDECDGPIIVKGD